MTVNELKSLFEKESAKVEAQTGYYADETAIYELPVKSATVNGSETAGYTFTYSLNGIKTATKEFFYNKDKPTNAGFTTTKPVKFSNITFTEQPANASYKLTDTIANLNMTASVSSGTISSVVWYLVSDQSNDSDRAIYTDTASKTDCIGCRYVAVDLRGDRRGAGGDSRDGCNGLVLIRRGVRHLCDGGSRARPFDTAICSLPVILACKQRVGCLDARRQIECRKDLTRSDLFRSIFFFVLYTENLVAFVKIFLHLAVGNDLQLRDRHTGVADIDRADGILTNNCLMCRIIFSRFRLRIRLIDLIKLQIFIVLLQADVDLLRLAGSQRLDRSACRRWRSTPALSVRSIRSIRANSGR